MTTPRNALSIRAALPTAVAAAILAITSGTTFAADPATARTTLDAPVLTLDAFTDLQSASTLTGDWGGIRKQLADKGVTFDLSLTQVYQGVLSGGRDKGWNYSGRENISINLDTEKMGLWPGGFLFIEGEGNYGEFVGARETGALLPANTNQIFPSPDSPNFNLPAFQYTQFLSKQFGVFIGKLETITNGDLNEFAHGKGNSGFLNTAFSFNPVAALVVPYSALGVGMVFLPTSDPNELIITVSVIDSEGEPGDCGFDTAFDGGTSYLAEGRYTTHLFNMTGHHLVGGGYSDRLFTDLDQNLRNFIIPGLPIQQSSGSWFVNYNFDQYVWQPDPKVDRGVGIFGRFGGSDGDANPIHVFYSGGIGGKGVIPGRDNDRFGVGYYYIQTANARSLARLNFGDSQGFEAFYEIALTPWASFTPDIQIIDPGEEDTDTAIVLGARLELKF